MTVVHSPRQLRCKSKEIPTIPSKSIDEVVKELETVANGVGIGRRESREADSHIAEALDIRVHCLSPLYEVLHDVVEGNASVVSATGEY